MKVSDFDFELDDELIALHPATPRDASRLLVVEDTGALGDRQFADLADLLLPGDALVLNDTRVIPAALTALRLRDGGPGARISFNLNRRLAPDRWQAFARPAKKLKSGNRLRFGLQSGARVCESGVLEATVEDDPVDGQVVLQFDLAGPDLDIAIANLGEMPLPPYIASKRDRKSVV